MTAKRAFIVRPFGILTPALLVIIYFALSLAASACQREPRGGSIVSNSCTAEAAKKLAHAYVLATPILNGLFDVRVGASSELVRYVRENTNSFGAGKPAIVCAVACARRLIDRGVARYDPQALERAYNTGGPIEFAPEVANNLNRAATDGVAMGQELEWLATVLPPMSAGNLGPFNAGGTPLRKMLGDALRASGPMLASDPMSRGMFVRAMRSHAAQFEAIVLANLTSGG